MRFKKTEKNISKKSTSTISGRSVIGLDIGQVAIKMVQLSGKSANQIQLEKYAIEYLPQNVISGNEIVDYDQLVSHLQQCYSKLKTNCKQVNLGLPYGTVTIEEDLLFDPTGDVSLQEFVELHLSSVGSLDEMSYDWTVLSSDSKTQQQSVLMVAAKTENVERASDLVDEIGVSLSNVDVDILAMTNAFAFVDAVEAVEFGFGCVAMFDVGDTTMKTLVSHAGKILYKQESALGLEQLVQLVQRTYQTSDSEALDMITGASTRPSDYTQMISQNFNMQITQEVQRALQFYSTTQSVESPHIKQIYISGSGCIAGTGLEHMIHEQTNIPARQVVAVNVVANKSKIDDAQLDKDANALSIAFGLALRGLV